MPENDNVLGMDANATPNGNDAGGTPQGENNLDFLEGIDGEPAQQDGGDTGEMADDGDDTGEPQGDDAQPKKFAGMYNTIEELERAYKGLQTQYQKTKEQNKGLLSQLTEPQAPQAQVQQPIQPTVPQGGLDASLVAKAFSENPAGTMQLLAQYYSREALSTVQPQLEKMNLATEINSVKEVHSDFSQYENDIATILKSNPALMNTPGRIEIAYKMAKADALTSATNKALQNGIQQGYKQAQRKQTIPESGRSAGAQKQAPKSVEDTIADEIMSFAGKRGIF
jgi:hypothetical protein